MQLTRKGDSLRADKIVMTAMKIDEKGVIARTGQHRGRMAIAERNVLCVIDREMVKAK